MKRLPDKPWWIAARLSSFRQAYRGIGVVFWTQPHARIHGLAAIGVTVLGVAVGLSPSEWCWIVVAIALVLSAEAFNTSLERLSDKVSPEWDPLIRDAKDSAAGAVLLAAIGAALIGTIIFLPHLFR